MIPPQPSSGLTTERTHPTQQAWSPPAMLLEAEGGDIGLIVRLIDAFGRDTDERIGQMLRTLAASDFTSIRAEAHAIRGSARMMGADEVAEACEELENACDLRDRPLIAAHLNRAQEFLAEIRGAMAAYSHRGRTDSSAKP
jgi:HPt (histidine-containing phosphotransfer) domain-containing protein